MTRSGAYPVLVATLITFVCGCGMMGDENAGETDDETPKNFVKTKVAATSLSGENPSITLAADVRSKYLGICTVEISPVENGTIVKTEPDDIYAHPDGYFRDDEYIRPPDFIFPYLGCDTLEKKVLHGEEISIPKTYWAVAGQKSVPGDTTRTVPVLHKYEAKVVRVKFKYFVENKHGKVVLKRLFKQDVTLAD